MNTTDRDTGANGTWIAVLEVFQCRITTDDGEFKGDSLASLAPVRSNDIAIARYQIGNRSDLGTGRPCRKSERPINGVAQLKNVD